MLGWGRRKDAQAVEAMREQLAAADMHARSVLAAVAQTDSRWSKDREDRARAQLATAGVLEEVRVSAAENTADITRALHHVADMCSQVVERLDLDRDERRALTDAINLLARQHGSPLETPSQVLGGTVIGAPEPPPAPDASRNGEAAYEISLNGNGNGNGVHADEIRLADYEDAPAPAAPFGTIDAYRPATEPYRAVEVIDVVEVAEAAPPAAKVSTWDAVPPPRAPEPAPIVEPAPISEPAPIAEGPRAYDAFAGLPLLQPAEAVRESEPAPFVAPAPVVEPPPVVAASEPEVANGIDRHWNESHRLTESNTFRPSGGTRLTPRRSTSQPSTR